MSSIFFNKMLQMCLLIHGAWAEFRTFKKVDIYFQVGMEAPSMFVTFPMVCNLTLRTPSVFKPKSNALSEKGYSNHESNTCAIQDTLHKARQLFTKPPIIHIGHVTHDCYWRQFSLNLQFVSCSWKFFSTECAARFYRNHLEENLSTQWAIVLSG